MSAWNKKRVVLINQRLKSFFFVLVEEEMFDVLYKLLLCYLFLVSFASLPFETEYAKVGIYFLVSDLFLVPASFVGVTEEFLDLWFV